MSQADERRTRWSAGRGFIPRRLTIGLLLGVMIAAAAPLRRIGRPDDMAGAAIYLSSRAGAYLTGAIIPVDGGIATTR